MGDEFKKTNIDQMMVEFRQLERQAEQLTDQMRRCAEAARRLGQEGKRRGPFGLELIALAQVHLQNAKGFLAEHKCLAGQVQQRLDSLEAEADAG